jgi:hypothetical protein
LKSERSKKGGEDRAQQKPQPVEQEAEVVADGREHGVDGIAGTVSEMVAAHAVLGLEMTDHRLDGSAPFHVALDLRGDAALLTGGVDLELVIGRRIVSAVSGIGDGALDGVADHSLHRRDNGGEGTAIVWIAGERCDVGDKLSTLAAMQQGGDAYFDPKFIGPVRVAFADAFHFRSVQKIDLRPALVAVLVAHAAGQAHRLGKDLMQGVIAGNLAADVADYPTEIGPKLA